MVLFSDVKTRLFLVELQQVVLTVSSHHVVVDLIVFFSALELDHLFISSHHSSQDFYHGQSLLVVIQHLT